MKSKTDKLEERGFLVAGLEEKYSETNFEQRIAFLESKIAVERTVGARLLTKSSNFVSINYLINALIKEKKLYPKIEICNTLVTFELEAVGPLIDLLGKIGKNQHKEIPKKKFNKKSYPLPRDIASRTLTRIGSKALPQLTRILETNNLTQLSELIDAIGFICFYEPQKNIYKLLKDCYCSNSENKIIKWKIIRAMSAFPESELFLKEQQSLTSEVFNLEIERSLSLIWDKRSLKV